jgi:hypothetical protein
MTIMGKVRKTNQSEVKNALFISFKSNMGIAPDSHFLGFRFAEQAGRFEDQDEDEKRKGKDIFIIA